MSWLALTRRGRRASARGAGLFCGSSSPAFSPDSSATIRPSSSMQCRGAATKTTSPQDGHGHHLCPATVMSWRISNPCRLKMTSSGLVCCSSHHAAIILPRGRSGEKRKVFETLPLTSEKATTRAMIFCGRASICTGLRLRLRECAILDVENLLVLRASDSALRRGTGI